MTWVEQIPRTVYPLEANHFIISVVTVCMSSYVDYVCYACTVHCVLHVHFMPSTCALVSVCVCVCEYACIPGTVALHLLTERLIKQLMNASLSNQCHIREQCNLLQQKNKTSQICGTWLLISSQALWPSSLVQPLPLLLTMDLFLAILSWARICLCVHTHTHTHTHTLY